MGQVALLTGPQTPGIIQVARFLWNPFQYLEKCGKRYGDVFTLNYPELPRAVVISDPALIKQVFREHGGKLQAGKVNKKFSSMLGQYSLLNMDGEQHQRHRKLILPPLHGGALNSYTDTMIHITKEMSATWKDKTTIFEMRLILAYLLTYFKLSLEPSYMPKARRQGNFLASSKHLPILVEKI